MLLHEKSLLVYQEFHTAGTAFIKWICIDLDISKKNIDQNDINPENLQLVFDSTAEICNYLNLIGIPYLLEFSGRRGFHLWIIFEDLQAKEAGYKLINLIFSKVKLRPSINADKFPKTIGVNKNTKMVGFGIKLPLSQNKRSKKLSYFLRNIEDFDFEEGARPAVIHQELLRTQLSILEDYQPLSNAQLTPLIEAYDADSQLSALKGLSFLRMKAVKILSPEAEQLDNVLLALNQCDHIREMLTDYQKGISNKDRMLLVGLLGRLQSEDKPNLGYQLLLELFSRIHNFRRDITEEKLKLKFADYYLVKIDIKNFYDRIDLQRLEIKLYEEANPSVAQKLDQLSESDKQRYKHIIRYFTELSRKTTGNAEYGLPQGPAYARYLAELYLLGLDRLIEQELIRDMKREFYYRFVDDIFVFVETEGKAKNVLKLVDQWASVNNLELNKSKTEIENVGEYDRAGKFKRFQDDAKYLINKANKNKSLLSEAEIQEALSRLDNLTNDLKFGLKDNIRFFYFQFSGDTRLNFIKKKLIKFLPYADSGRGTLFMMFYADLIKSQPEVFWSIAAEQQRLTGLSLGHYLNTILFYEELGQAEQAITGQLIQDISNRNDLSYADQSLLITISRKYNLPLSPIFLQTCPKPIIDSAMETPDIPYNQTDYAYIEGRIRDKDKRSFVHELYELVLQHPFDIELARQVARYVITRFSVWSSEDDFNAITDSGDSAKDGSGLDMYVYALKFLDPTSHFGNWLKDPNARLYPDTDNMCVKNLALNETDTNILIYVPELEYVKAYNRITERKAVQVEANESYRKLFPDDERFQQATTAYESSQFNVIEARLTNHYSESTNIKARVTTWLTIINEQTIAGSVFGAYLTRKSIRMPKEQLDTFINDGAILFPLKHPGRDQNGLSRLLNKCGFSARELDFEKRVAPLFTADCSGKKLVILLDATTLAKTANQDRYFEFKNRMQTMQFRNNLEAIQDVVFLAPAITAAFKRKIEEHPIFKGKSISWANYAELTDADYLFGNALMNTENREIVEQLLLDRELLKRMFIIPEHINFDEYNLDPKKMNILLRVGSLPSKHMRVFSLKPLNGAQSLMDYIDNWMP
eukprot:gene9405-9485_t